MIRGGSILRGWVAGLFVFGTAWAQIPEGPVRGFDLPLVDKQTFRRKARIRGDLARPLSRDLVELSGLRLENFAEGGRTNLVLLAEHCELQVAERRLRSAGELRVVGGDGVLTLQGRGFSWGELEGLVISNAVDARLVRETGTQEAAVVAAPSQERARALEIRATRFMYREGLAVFGPDVQATDPEGTLRCGRLAFKLHLEEGAARTPAVTGDVRQQVELLEAEESVEVRGPLLQASADRATYRVSDGTLEVSGQARWRSGESEGEAGRIELRRSEGILRAYEGVLAQFPAAGLMPAEGLLPVGEGKAETVGRLQVRSQELEVRPEAGFTNRSVATFREQVRVTVTEVDGQLTCNQLAVRYVEDVSGVVQGVSASVEPDRSRFQAVDVVAMGGVDIRQGTNRVECVRAVYVAATAEVVMEGPVSWALAAQRGQANSLTLDARSRATTARGDVRLQLPFSGLGGPARLVASAARGSVAAKPTGESAEIACEEFVFRAGSNQQAPGWAAFRGGVRLTSSASLEMSCQEMETWLAPRDNRLERLEAKREVVLRSLQPPGERSARGDLAVYTAQDQRLRLTGEPGVEIVVADGTGTSRGRGAEAVYDVAGDTLELTTQAEVVSNRGVLTGDTVRLDRSAREVSASGLWRIRMPVKAAKAVGDVLPQGARRP